MCKNEAQSCSCSFTITQSWLAVCRSAPVLHTPQQFFDLFMRKSRFLIDDRAKRGAGVQVNATKQRRRCVPVCINKWPHRNKQQWWFSHRLRGHFYPHCFCTKPNIHIKQMTQVLTKFLLRGAWQPDIRSSPREDLMALTQTIQQSERWAVRDQRKRDTGACAPLWPTAVIRIQRGPWKLIRLSFVIVATAG